MINNDVDNSTNDEYATQMYLISKDDFSLLTSVKEKGQSETLLPQPPPPIPPPTQPPPDQPSEPNSNVDQPSAPAPMEEKETGQGKKKWTKENVADFNQKFLSKKNLRKYLEDRDWEELYKRLLPILKSNNTDKTQAVNDLIQLNRDEGANPLLFNRPADRERTPPRGFRNIPPTARFRRRDDDDANDYDDDDDDDDDDGMGWDRWMTASPITNTVIKNKKVAPSKGKAPRKAQPYTSSGPYKNTRHRKRYPVDPKQVANIKKNLAQQWEDEDDDDVNDDPNPDVPSTSKGSPSKKKRKGGGRKFIRNWVNF